MHRLTPVSSRGNRMGGYSLTTKIHSKGNMAVWNGVNYQKGRSTLLAHTPESRGHCLAHACTVLVIILVSPK